ncbi:hypothetical protein DL89DRAFT_293317 [Linderina pennispora]|uniref:Sucraseferredoxin-like protein n=1 Tax=Linderina pennispora TaxID=61395 RepID=A0A1Y1W843_9FUNG|nr:uncharacterized protein DL89DRAFT_293317 [Linderina pennispora]ORX69701.1 hypothetical protein DL89DRAFT_293317 [Linderina pennispora]
MLANSRTIWKLPQLALLARRPLHAQHSPLAFAAKHTAGAGTIDGRVGTVSPHRHHLVVCNSRSSEWPSKIEGLSPAITALARGSVRLPGRAMVTLSDFAPLPRRHGGCSCSAPAEPDVPVEEKFAKIDVAVFPHGLVAEQLDVDGVQKLLEWLGHDVLPTSWTSTDTGLPQPQFAHRWLDMNKNRHIFICTHGSRDQLCGVHGTQLLRDVRALIADHGLGKHVAAWETSHVGGHKYAANAIVYPRGDWYATWCDKCRGEGGAPVADTAGRTDAQALLDAVTRDAVWWESWRGAVNMTKNDQITTYRRNYPGLSAQEAEHDDSVWTPQVRARHGVY